MIWKHDLVFIMHVYWVAECIIFNFFIFLYQEMFISDI